MAMHDGVPQPTPEISGQSWRDFVAGTVAGVALVLSGHPFDTIKVRLQTHNAMADALKSKHAFQGVVDCTLQTVRREGFFALYKGMSGPLLTVPVLNALVFAAYEQGKRFLSKSTEKHIADERLSITQITLAGSWAGLANAYVVGPVELIKTRLQVQYEGKHDRAKRKYRGPIDCIKQTVNLQGPRGLFRGMSSTVLREIPAYGAQFATYEWIKRGLMSASVKDDRKNDSKNNATSEALTLLVAGAGAGIGCWIFSYPQDIIKSLLQIQPDGKPAKFKSRFGDGGFYECGKHIVTTQGWKGLWRGFSACLTRAIPANACGFLAYEWTCWVLKGNN